MPAKKNIKTYMANPNLKAAGVAVNFTEEQVQEYLKCSKDPVYFMKTYMKIVNLDQGLMPFDMWDFQEDIVNKIHNNRFVIAKLPRQTGKTYTTVGYLLHYVLFNQDVSAAILANKLDTAQNILGRLQLAYEYLPKWLQQGVVEWNKRSIELENGSKILASSTSSSAVRGGSYNLIFLDEFAFVPFQVAENFFNSVYPTISSGKNTKVIIVSTPNGMNMFYKLWMDAINKRNEYIPIEVHWSAVPGRDEKWKLQTIANTNQRQFDQEFDCQFIGSTDTLISGPILRSIPFQNPFKTHPDGIRYFELPKKDRIYLASADISRGVGQDYHAMCILDITELPYKVVCTFKNNEMSPLVVPTALHSLCKQYNNAYLLVEINDIGQQVSDILHNEYEYDGLLSVSVRGRKGQVIDEGFGKGETQLGVKTTEVTKKLGCSMLKTLIEDQKLIINDFNLLEELTTFVHKKGTYQADDGAHDDLVMSVVLSCWVISQPYFKDLLNMDFRKKLHQDKIDQLEEDLVPFGFIVNGSRSDDVIIDGDGTLWTIQE